MRSIYSTTDLANLLEVNESTIKRWADSGHIECVKTKGGHRRFPIAAVLRFAQENRIALRGFGFGEFPDGDMQAHLAAGNISKLIPELKRAALSGKIDLALEILRVGIAARPHLLSLYHDVVFPPLVQIGEQWEKGTLTVDEEHLASRTIREATARLQAELFQKPSVRRTVLLACYEDELHDFSTQCVANYFESEGWKTVFLGQATPTDSVVHAVRKHQPEVTVVSTIALTDERKFIRDMNEAVAPATRSVGGMLVIGGPRTRERFAGTVQADMLTDSILQYESLTTRPIPPAAAL